jgi:phospholipase A1/A2
MRRILSLLLAGILANVARAQFETLLVPPAEAVPAGRLLRLTLYLNNPAKASATFKLPTGLKATLESPTEQRTLLVAPVDAAVVEAEVVIAPMSFRNVVLTVMVPDTVEGNVSLRLLGLTANPIMFAVTPAEKVRVTPRAAQAAEAASADRPRDLNQATAFEQMRNHLLPYEPIYFAVGFNQGANARFQFSFKFRILSPLGNTSDLPSDIYFGYTQTSLWDLHTQSKPFYDTSYKPTLFYYRELVDWKPAWIDRLSLQAGLQHESNGQAVKTSRSLNTFYAMPIASWTKWRTWEFLVAPRAIAYLEKGENPDLPRYRGYVEWLLSAEHGQDFKFTAYLRKGTGSGYGSMELNASWGLQSWLPGLGGRMQLQYFNGWGESLLDYNKRRPDQVRLGFMLVP